ncbi:MAG TPA: DciA family protein [Dongiaceae bacterium]|jgi:hypothetical protein|nr:DciA family protein [Dongiaceae bacterium]
MTQDDKNAPRRNAPTRLSAELPGLTRTAFRNTLGGRGFAEAGLITEWAAVVGEDIARMSRPLQLAFPRGERKGGVLTIACGGAAAVELQHLKPQILDRVNTHFGYGAVREIRFKQGEAPRRAQRRPESRKLTATETADVAASVSTMPEGAVKDSLMRLGLAVRRNSPRR